MIRFGMHSSLWTAEWTREAAERIVPEAARRGLQVIEVALLQPERIDAPHSAALFQAHGVAPSCSLALPIEAAASLHPDRAEAFLLRAVETAHALGATMLCGVLYGTLGHRSGSPPTEEEYDNIVKALKPAARRAQDLGVTLGLEPCNRYETHLLNTAAQGVAMIERLGEPNVGLHLDTYHMNIEEKGLPAGMRAAGRHLKYLHLSESDRGVPGTGTVNFDTAFAALSEMGFEGDMVVESFVTLPPGIAAALSVWRPVARDADEVLDEGVTYLRDLGKRRGLIH